jgi:hypothetical protein
MRLWQRIVNAADVWPSTDERRSVAAMIRGRKTVTHTTRPGHCGVTRREMSEARL